VRRASADREQTGAPSRMRAPRDLTRGSLFRALLVLAAPTVVEQLLYSTPGLAHAYWLAGVSGTALSGIVMGTSLRLVLISPMMGLSMGGLAVVARHLGAGEHSKADRAVTQTILLVGIFVVPSMILGLVLGPTFLQWMGAEGQVLADACAFLKVILGGLLFMEMLPTVNGVIRGTGHPEYALRNNVINVAVVLVTEPILVLGLGPAPMLGVRGVAWATVLGALAGTISQAVVLVRGSAGVQVQWRHAVPDWSVMRRILRVALPTSVQRFSPNLSEALLLRLVSSFGDGVLGGYSLVTRLLLFLRAPGYAIGSASAALVGQNLGAGTPKRSERAASLGSLLEASLALLLFGGLALCARPILGLFESNPKVIHDAVLMTYFMVVGGPAQGFLSVMSSVLGSAGDAVAAMLVNVTALWLVQLPVGWGLSHGLGMGPTGIWLGMAAGFALGAVVIRRRFKQGYWKQVVL